MIHITDESEANELLDRARAVPPWRFPNWLAAPTKISATSEPYNGALVALQAGLMWDYCVQTVPRSVVKYAWEVYARVARCPR